MVISAAIHVNLICFLTDMKNWVKASSNVFAEYRILACLVDHSNIKVTCGIQRNHAMVESEEVKWIQ